MTKQVRRMKNPITLRRLLPLAAVLLFAVAFFIAPVAAEEHTTHDETWTAWTNPNSLPNTPGNYYLETDVSLTPSKIHPDPSSPTATPLDDTAGWEVPISDDHTPVNLCLNGHIIALSGSTSEPYGSVIFVPYYETLNLYDCTEVMYYFQEDSTGKWINPSTTQHSNQNSELFVTGGIITGGSSVVGGGVMTAGTFNMYSGNIVGNSASQVSENEESGYGGGVAHYPYTTYWEDPSAGDYTGDGNFNMYGGTIAGNTAVYGGGVMANGYSAIQIMGGTISYNTATNAGGGIIVGGESYPIYVSGGNIVHNKVNTNTGGGVYAGNANLIHLSKNPVIEDNFGQDGTANNLYAYDLNPNVDDSRYGFSIDGELTAGAHIQITSALSSWEKERILTQPFTTSTGGIGYLFLDGGSETYTMSTKDNGDGTSVLSFVYTSYDISKDEGISGGDVTITGGDGTTTNPATARITEPIKLTATPDEHYTFSEFVVTKSSSGEEVPVTEKDGVYTFTMPTSAVTVSAEFDPINYDITYVDGGTLAEGVTNPATYNIEEAITLNDPTKEGYTFKGWYDNEGFTGEAVTGWSAGQKENALTFYAKWEIKQVTITFKDDDGKTLYEITQDYGTSVTAPADPTKTGYTFAGWFNGETAYTIPATMPAENIDLTAHWTAEEYDISYVLNEGTNPADVPAKHTYGTATDLPTPTRTGYTFGGWFTASDLSGNPVSTLAADGSYTSSISLYAKWDIETYTIIWQYDNKTTYKEQIYQYGEIIIAPENPQKDSTEEFSYTFDKWNPEFVEGTTATASATYVAVFTDSVNEYTVTWTNPEDATFTDLSEKVPYGTKPTYKGDVPTKAADEENYYVFNDWEPVLADVTKDITYEATFTAVKKENPAGQEDKPILPLGTTETTDASGKTTTKIAAAGDNQFTVSNDGKTASLEDENGVVTLVIGFKDGSANRPGQNSAVSGEINTIKAEYKPEQAQTTEGVGEVKHKLTLGLKSLDADLPQINANVNTEAVKQVTDKEPKIKPAAMITVDSSINSDLNGVQIDFLVNRTWADANIDKLWIFHYHTGENPTFTKLVKGTNLLDGDAENYIARHIGIGFSTYGLATGELTTNQPDDDNSGSSTPQGSSVWLTESQTPTENPSEQPTDKPTDTAPADVPTTQPTPTETESPLSVLAVVAGLGAVAVLGRRR